MRRAVRGGLAACLAVPLLLMMTVTTAHAEDGPSEDSGIPTGSLTDELIAAADRGLDTPAEVADALSLPQDGAGSLTIDEAGRVVATVYFDAAPSEAQLAAVREHAEITRVLTIMPALTISVAAAEIDAVRAIDGVVDVQVALAPFVGSGFSASEVDVAIAEASSEGATPAAAAGCSALPAEAAEPLRSDVAREAYDVDGTGVTVAILSDSFAQLTSPTSWAEDVASGALPGTDNPCGYTQEVDVLADGHTPKPTDEGRAMAQLVHGIAPGAKLLFSDVGETQAEFAENILMLAESGADIIVDDVFFVDETYYQQGYVSAAINLARTKYGAVYFTAAQNQTTVNTQGTNIGKPNSSWQTTVYRPTECPTWVADEFDETDEDGVYDCLDFDPGAGVQAWNTLTLSAQSTGALTLIGSIAEPAFGVTTSYAVGFGAVDPVTGTTKFIDAVPSLGGTLPGIFGTVTVEPGSQVQMVMVRTDFDPEKRDPAVYLGFRQDSGPIAELELVGDNLTDWSGESTYGHTGDGSATSVGSANWQDVTEMRAYSSIGPRTMIFDPLDLFQSVPSARKSPIENVDAPAITSVDGTQTTFFGQEDPSGIYRFYGTSAAAPNAAAVAALALEHAPALTESELTNAIVSTTRGTADGGPVNPYLAFGVEDSNVLGSGIVDAMALLESLPDAPETPTDLSVTETRETGFSIKWSAAAGGDRQLVTLYQGDVPDANAVQSEQVEADVTTATFTGLEPNTRYTAVVTTVNTAGSEASSSLEETTLAPAPADVTVSDEDSDGFTLSWTEKNAPAHYTVDVRASIEGETSAPVAGLAADGVAVAAANGAPIELPAGTSEVRITGLIAATTYEAIISAVNSNDVGNEVGVQAATAAAAPDETPAADSTGDADGQGNAGGGDNQPPAATNTTGSQAGPGTLSTTGGNSLLPWGIGAGVLVLIGVGVAVAASVRRNRQANAEQAGTEHTDAEQVDTDQT